MVRYKAGFAAGLAVVALGGSAPAAAQAFDGTQLIHAVGLADLQQFVLQHGDTVVGTGKSGTVTVLAKTSGGLNYLLVGTACNQPGVVGCESIFMQIKYTITPAVTDATLAKANTDFAAVKVWKDQAGTIAGVSRYVILHSGVTRQNVVDNIDLLLGMAPSAAKIAFATAPPAK